MKRVAFLVQPDHEAWIGGFNYLRNLLRAIYSNIDRNIEPVLFVHPAFKKEDLIGFPELEVIYTPLVDSRNVARMASKALFSIFDRDPVLEFLLKKNNIDVISHSLMHGISEEISIISWIPDFQHIRLPQNFSYKQRIQRNKQFLKLVKVSRRIILSSKDVKNDFDSFAPHARDKACILPFVSSFENTGMMLTYEQLCKKFQIRRPFFFLPNQFWVHKNHMLVVEALYILKNLGVETLVLATGSKLDHRNPHYFEHLMNRVKYYQLEDSFRVLGMVTLAELQSLMLNSLSMINPSSFEGWSTTVEESKSLGVPIILSDIPVHLEQAPILGRYFSSGSAESLAKAMIASIDNYDQKELSMYRLAAANELQLRIEQFGRDYEKIVLSS